MQIELRQLKYFVTVADELHFGRAAQKLNMTQPPLSQAIQGLEKLLDAKLFVRTTRHISLSAAGAALLPEARRLLLQAEALPRLVQRAANGESGHLSLAFVSIADYSILPPSLRRFREKHPDVQIELRGATTDVQLKLLEHSEIDVGVLIPPIPEHLNASITYKKLLSEPLMLAIPETIAPRPSPNSLTSYKDLPLILFPRKIAPALHDTILACFKEAGLTPIISQEAIQMQTIIALVSANMGIALVPQSVSNLKRAGVVYHELSQCDSELEIGIAWRRDNQSPVLKTFLALFEE
jgi:DNA-binding transcriptional LysR family regulator